MTTIETTSIRAYAGFDDLGPTHTDPGKITLLMLPGWCGDRDVFAPLAQPLVRRHRVVVTDLRGHGGNRHQTEDFDSARQVQDVLDLIEERRIERVVPVALSHAGWFAIELRRRLGAHRVPGIVLLDWMVLGTPPGFDGALQGLQAPEAWQDVRGQLFGMWTTGVDEQAVHRYVESMGRYGLEHWSRAGREISASFTAEGTPLAALEAMSPSCPTLHLYAQPSDEGYLAAQQHVAAQHPWFRVARLTAGSHFPMFEVPGDMAAQIEDFTCSLA